MSVFESCALCSQLRTDIADRLTFQHTTLIRCCNAAEITEQQEGEEK